MVIVFSKSQGSVQGGDYAGGGSIYNEELRRGLTDDLRRIRSLRAAHVGIFVVHRLRCISGNYLRVAAFRCGPVLEVRNQTRVLGGDRGGEGEEWIPPAGRGTHDGDRP
jgi:hypothetical protein